MNSIKTLFTLFSDGTPGNPISMARVLSFIMVMLPIATKFYNAWLTKTPIVWDATDLALFGSGLGMKSLSKTQENTAAKIAAVSPALPGDAKVP